VIRAFRLSWYHSFFTTTKFFVLLIGLVSMISTFVADLEVEFIMAFDARAAFLITLVLW